jgi:hypothetical protein
MPAPEHGIDVWHLLKALRPGLVVRHVGGQVCTVEGFDITKGRFSMPVRLKPLCGGDAFAAILPDVTHVLVEVAHEINPREIADRPAATLRGAP